MHSVNRLQNMPVSFFAMVMGLTGLTIAWEQASFMFDYNGSVYNALLILSVLVFALLSVLYLYKSVRYRASVAQEWSNPVKLSFVPAISISLLLFSVAFLPIVLSHTIWNYRKMWGCLSVEETKDRFEAY